MTTGNDPAQLVSPESRAILDAADLYAVQRPNESHLFNVFDADGDFRVPPDTGETTCEFAIKLVKLRSSKECRPWTPE